MSYERTVHETTLPDSSIKDNFIGEVGHRPYNDYDFLLQVLRVLLCKPASVLP